MRNRVLLGLAMGYAGIVVIGPVLNNKLADVYGLSFTASMPLLAIAYILLDVVANQWGKREARTVVLCALIVRMVVYLLFIPGILALPASREPAGFSGLFHQALRNFISGEGANFLFQFVVAVPAFVWLRDRMQGRWFVLRYLVITVPILVMQTSANVIGSYAFVPGVDMVTLVTGQATMKLLFSVAAWPLAFIANRVVGTVHAD
jgi:uncharacterized PurR-regulated membrane protein YhhQ (DUF165 family)